MKRQKSVSRLIVLILAMAIILFSFVICVVTQHALRTGLTDYFVEQLSENATVVKEEIDLKRESSLKVAHYIQDSFQKFYPIKGFDFDQMNELVEYAVKYFGVSNATFYNSNCIQVSTPKYGSVANFKLLGLAVNGTSIADYEYEGGKLYAIQLLPLKYHEKIFGAVSVRSLISSNELLENIKEYANVDTGFFYGDRFFITTLEGMEGEKISNPEVFETCQSGQSVTIKEKLNGTTYISYYFPFINASGKYLTTIFIGKKLNLVTTIATGIFSRLAGVILLSTILCVFGFWALIHFLMMKPLVKIDKAIENLSSGDADLTARLDTKSNDEFAHLGQNVNKFIEMLQEIITQLGNAQDQLNEVGMDLGSNAQESASATAEILANIESVRHQAETQNSAVANTTNVLDRSSQVVDELTNLIDDQTSGITESSAAIEQMLGNINTVTKSVEKMSASYEKLNSTVDQGKEKLTNVDEKVKEISEQSRSLVQANSIISQIASETNLLAMNAAIEASHAGDAGKGFSVVADEIRVLAENSSKQSKTISAELRKITQAIDSVVELSNDSSTAFNAIVDQIKSTDLVIREINNAMEEQSASSKQIFDALSDMKEKSVEVSEKSKTMAEGIMNVAKDMGSVNQISSTISGSMDEMTTGMQQIGNATQNVSELADQTRKHIGEMNAKLTQFTV